MIEITKSIKEIGFENTVLIFSEAESRKIQVILVG